MWSMASAIPSRVFTKNIAIAVVFLSCFFVFFASRRFVSPNVESSISQWLSLDNSGHGGVNRADPYCDSIPSTSDIVVIVKTGANEIFHKLPTQLITTLRCIPELLVFSDLEQDIGPIHVYDALDNVTEAAKSTNPDFDYYRMLHEYHRSGQDISKLRESKSQAAWNLDKYKFLHVLEKTWNMMPRRKWYVLIEADTYLVWSNLLLWLERLDSGELHYLGSPTRVGDDHFAHGGSGIVLSGAALSKFAKGHPGIAASYDAAVKDENYGDYMLMKALRDKGIEFSWRFPMIQGEKPSTIPFGPGPDGRGGHWCQPVITMHHVTPEEASGIRKFEQQRPNVKQPLLFHELFDFFVQPHLTSELTDWDNLSDDATFRTPGIGDDETDLSDLTPSEREAHFSFEHCGKACDEASRCFQYLYHDGTCQFSYYYRLGAKRGPESGSSYQSGFNLRKIALDQAANDCHSPEWL